ncbi:hypothetical protein C8F04DRAFT_1187407 [Mycena alexandri]|uniref:Secreted protein n=1 Tax=Mycena alexandri TaxID=1745969 RepID=A0AAD6SQ28_9AGAR|nr:hypothetical protein C8F04DRAFT_1187407 [Mycena alexandri]
MAVVAVAPALVLLFSPTSSLFTRVLKTPAARPFKSLQAFCKGLKSSPQGGPAQDGADSRLVCAGFAVASCRAPRRPADITGTAGNSNQVNNPYGKSPSKGESRRHLSELLGRHSRSPPVRIRARPVSGIARHRQGSRKPLSSIPMPRDARLCHALN